MNKILPGSELSFLLIDAARLWRQAVERALYDADHSLTASELRALTYVARHVGARQRDLADMMGIEPMSLSSLLESLEKYDLIERHIDQTDRRARRVHLTPKASKVFESIAPVTSKVQARALTGLSAKQQQGLEDALRAMRHNFIYSVSPSG